MIIDTHAHINFKAFNDDAHKIIHKSLDENTWMILVGSDNKTSKRALELANRYERGVYVAVGLHPIHVDDEFFSYDIYEKLAQFDKTVAVGEIGLDYYHINKEQDIVSVKRKQKDLFLNQLKLARSMNLPAIIHCRQAHDDMIEILEDFKKENKNLFPDVRSWGVMHCFSGDENLAWKYFSLGLIISFTGIITFSRQWDDLIRKLPNDKFMIETDCPYMTPEPFRGERNEPILVKYVAKRIAEIKNLTEERVAEITTENAKKLFNI